MRQIVLDTETTGIAFEQGHRIIEIGCIELIERKITGNHFHVYLNPQRLVDEGAFRVHGISDAFLEDKPLFEDKVSEFIKFIDGAELIIHNAPFDTGFIDSELSRAKWGTSLSAHCSIFDTLSFARTKFPGQRNSLDALCKRFNIDHFNRELHGALLDAEILAYVYLAMTGGQSVLFSDNEELKSIKVVNSLEQECFDTVDSPVLYADSMELNAHLEFTKLIAKKSGVNFWD